ncbi:MAG: sodium/proline symporter [Planctomycetes bacterium]|nr:sodium/proline symporter [Planctomycetota bacterium]
MDSTSALLATLVSYKLVLLGIGAWASQRTKNGADFHLAGHGLGPWVASISAAASSSSAWTLLGVSGAAFQWGLSAVWLFPACLFGFAINGWLIAGPLRRLARETGAVTLLSLLAHGLDPLWSRRVLRAGGIILLGSLLVYVASQFKAAGVTFGESFGLHETKAILVGGFIVLLYTMTGGFWAVSVTDLLQGLVMVLASLCVPALALLEVGGIQNLFEGLGALDEPVLMDWTRGFAGPTLLGFIVGTFGISLGYPGQPHVVNRFMAMRNDMEVRKGAWISIGWAVVIYAGMLLAGWCGRVLLADLGNHEAVLLSLTQQLFTPVWAGIIVAAILSAIMSTADSQLLSCSSTLSQDWGRNLAGRRGASLWLERGTVLVMGCLAITCAIFLDQSIFDSVLFAWSVLGAAFGPLLFVRLWFGPVPGRHAFSAMVVGALTSLLWAKTPALKGVLYELVPAFFLSFAIAFLGARNVESGKIGR